MLDLDIPDGNHLSLSNSRLFTSQLKKGGNYKDLKPAISLIIADFKLFNDTENWYNKFGIENKETGKSLTNLQELIFVELPKWKGQSNSLKEKNSKEKWGLFLSAEREEEFDRRWDADLDYNSGMARAKEEGLEQGIQITKSRGESPFLFV